jgi:hypothetical protein
MTREEACRLLDLPPNAGTEDVRRAHRELTKVWHPDRFAHDPKLRARAEEKIKEINEACETLLGMRRETSRARATAPPMSPRQRQMRNRVWAITCAAFAVAILLRRPTPGMIIVALVLLILSFWFARKLA